MPFLTEVEYQNKFLHFYCLLGISGRFYGILAEASFARCVSQKHFREPMFVHVQLFVSLPMNDVISS